MYAVNLGDWVAQKDNFAVAILLQPVIGRQDVVEAEPRRIDGTAVVLDCDDERAAAIVSIIRLKFQKYQFRCYHSNTGRGGWKRI